MVGQHTGKGTSLMTGTDYEELTLAPEGTVMPVLAYQCLKCYQVIDPRYGTGALQCNGCGQLIDKVLDGDPHEIGPELSLNVWKSDRQEGSI
jgi:hypothetical protein